MQSMIRPCRPLLKLLMGLAMLAGAGQALASEVLAVPTPQPFTEVIATPDQLRALSHGGFVLYLRHGQTDNQKPDRVDVDFNDCESQRPLIDAGRKQSAQVGEAMRRARIPLGELRVSPLCRARESAALAFPSMQAVVDVQLMYTANLTTEQKKPILENTRHLLSTPVAKGTNRQLVAHAPNLMDTIGYFPKESTLVIFRPHGEGKFDYIASIPPTAWPALLQNLKP